MASRVKLSIAPKVRLAMMAIGAPSISMSPMAAAPPSANAIGIPSAMNARNAASEAVTSLPRSA